MVDKGENDKDDFSILALFSLCAPCLFQNGYDRRGDVAPRPSHMALQ